MTFKIAVPELTRYSRSTGIGRVLYGLLDALGDTVEVFESRYERRRAPVVRNFAHGLTNVPYDADVVLFPQLTGVGALNPRSHYNSAVIVHDIGILDSKEDHRSIDLLTRWAVKRDVRHLRYASHIIAVSSFTKDRLLAYMPELSAKVSVIHSGVSAPFYQHRKTKDECRKSLEHIVGQRLKGPVLLYVGTERRRKNFTFLLDAINQLKPQHPGLTLVKIGSPGSLRDREHTLNHLHNLDLKIGRDLHLIPDVSDAELADAYKAVECFVSASVYEGFGLPYVESLSVGTPVVAVQTGILSTEIPGVTLGGSSVAEFAAAIDKTLAHILTVEDEANIRSYIHREYSWAQFAKSWMNIVTNSLDENRPLSPKMNKGVKRA